MFCVANMFSITLFVLDTVQINFVLFHNYVSERLSVSVCSESTIQSSQDHNLFPIDTLPPPTYDATHPRLIYLFTASAHPNKKSVATIALDNAGIPVAMAYLSSSKHSIKSR